MSEAGYGETGSDDGGSIKPESGSEAVIGVSKIKMGERSMSTFVPQRNAQRQSASSELLRPTIRQSIQTGPSTQTAHVAATDPARFDFNFRQIPIHSQSPVSLQAKLAISSPGDACEQEADRVSEQIMRSGGAQSERDEASSSSFHTSQTGSSHSLTPATQAFMSLRFGHDFSHVRVHTDRNAADAARTVQARAYTIGSDIVFGEGEYAPATSPGKQLLAHELTHVVQQQAPGATPVLSRDPVDNKKIAEDKERQELLETFTNGTGLTSGPLGQIEGAMRAFSLHQLRIMRDSGLRFSPGNSLPPEWKDKAKVDNLAAPAQYNATLRVIRISDKGTTDAVRHEMAHSWDHARTGKVTPIANLKDEARIKAENNTPPFLSETDAKQATQETVNGKVKSISIPISEMFDRYKKQAILHEQAFDITGVIHSKSTVKEFYAEGYSVFHSDEIGHQARLLYYAPELYHLLEAEAKKEGLPIPDRSAIDAGIKSQGLPE
jgi:hypothetical protein